MYRISVHLSPGYTLVPGNANVPLPVDFKHEITEPSSPHSRSMYHEMSASKGFYAQIYDADGQRVAMVHSERGE